MGILSLTSDEMVRGLINEVNTPVIAFDNSNLIFGKPSTLLNDPTANTQVAVRGVESVDYVGQTKVTYRRLDLGVLFQGNYRPAVTALGQSSLHRLLPDINRALGISLTDDDVDDIDLRLLEQGDQVTLEVVAKPNSLAYTGFTRVLFNRRFIQIGDVVKSTVLDELNHPDPILEGYDSVGLLTWGIDFSIMKKQLAVNPSARNRKGDWVDATAFKNALSEYFGYANYPDISGNVMTLVDYATKDVRAANRDYSRVVVHSGIRDNGYVGTAFFHYNI